MTIVGIDVTPSTIKVMQAYAPSSAAPDEEIEEFYSILEETLVSQPRSNIKLVLVDLMQKLGE